MTTHSKFNEQESRRVLQSVQDSPIMHNDVRGRDQAFDECWEETIHGRAFEKQNLNDHTQDHTNIQINTSNQQIQLEDQADHE